MQNESYNSKRDQSSTPTVTIIISAYNNPDYLRQSLQSVLNQTFTDYEIIVVDDCSPDDAVSQYDILEGVRFIRLDRNHGLAAPGRNVGIRESTGEYIAFLDFDDVWLPDKLEPQVKLLDENPNAGLTYCHFIMTDDDLTPLEKQPKLQPVSDDPLRQIILNNYIGSPSFVLIRREAILDAGGFDEELASSSDRDLWTKILCKRYPVYDPTPRVLYRTHSNQISRNMVSLFTARIQILIKALDYIHTERNDLVPTIRHRLFLNYWHLAKTRISRGDGISDVMPILIKGFRIKPLNIRLNLLIIRVYISSILNLMKK